MSEKPELGSLELIPLREYWEHEAHQFTPWLADNIDQLGEALGLNLEVEGTEVRVGPYRADIFAHATDENTPVLIENQLGATDNHHLGQLMMYAAGHDAATIVWIAGDFIDQHRAALDWLNRVTVKGINFFGVRIELWRIGDSAPAPKFHIVSKPNEWSKRMMGVKKGPRGARSPVYELYEAYWTGLVASLRSEYPYPLPKSSARNWISSRAPLPKGVKINLSVAEHERKVFIYVLISEEPAPGLFAFVSKRIERFVEAVGRPLEFEPRPHDRTGDFGWSFASQGLESDSREAEYRWVARTLPIITELIESMANEHKRGEAGASDAG